MKIQRSIAVSIRPITDWVARWKGADEGLIACWERGRELSQIDSTLAIQAQNGRLVPLPWKGGVAKKLKIKKKVGTYYYLAMWQGLRGEDLNVDTDRELSIVCTLTGVAVVFTHDLAKYGGAEENLD